MPVEQMWDWVREGLQEIVEASPEITTHVDDIKQALEAETAVLWTTDEGFVISTGITEWPTGRRVFLVWWAWARKRGTDLVEKHYPFFAAVARDAGFSAIEVRTTTDAVAEHLLKKGWTKSTMTLTRGLL